MVHPWAKGKCLSNFCLNPTPSNIHGMYISFQVYWHRKRKPQEVTLHRQINDSVNDKWNFTEKDKRPQGQLSSQHGIRTAKKQIHLNKCHTSCKETQNHQHWKLLSDASLDNCIILPEGKEHFMKERYNTWNYTFWHWRQMTVTTHFEDEETEPRQGNTSHLRDDCSVETVLLTPPMPTGEKGSFQYMVTVPGTDFCGHPLCVTRIVSRAPSYQVTNSWEAPNSLTRSTCVGRGRTTHCGNHKGIQTYHYTL